MALSFGSGVSRTLDPVARAFQNVVFQKGKPPLDSELNFQDSIHDEQMRQQIASMMPSGFVFDPTRAYEYYGFDKQNSNQFRFGRTNPLENDTPSIIAVVNGMIVQVSGTDIAASVDNVVKLYPAPTSNNRVDLVFLEVWQTLVAPNPATQNKPTASTIWKYGNVKFGGVNLPDDLQDTTLGFETTKRVQTQYRIRVVGSGVTGVDLSTYPDGMEDPAVLGQGTASVPQAGLFFDNMGKIMGDPSLWRAGNGNPANALGTVDGYVYAIPICAVFRRNSSVFVAVNSAGAANQNGSFNRTPSTITLPNPLTGATLLAQMRLNTTLLPTVALPATISVANLVGSGMDDPLHYAAGNSLFVQIDDEVLQITGVNTTLSTITIGSRGRNKTQITRHEGGTPVLFYSVRPDGLFADEVAPVDVLDLRRSVNPGAWDYNQLLLHNLAALMRNRLQTTWKQSLVGTSQGPVVTEVDYMYADNPAVPVNTIQVDGPDGIRTVFSDAATIQRDVTMLLDNNAALVNGYTNSQFDTNMVWDVGASFVPNGFVNNQGATGYWTNGSVIFVHVEGATANDGARGSFKWAPNVEAVRFLTPREYWKVGYPQGNLTDGDQYPVKMRFVGPETGQPPVLCLAHQPIADGETAVDSTAEQKHPGPMYPWQSVRFFFPFIVLGDVLNTNMVVNGLPVATTLNSTRYAEENVVEIDVGINFDLVNGYYTIENGTYALAPTAGLTNPLINGQFALYDLLTEGGRQLTGYNSNVVIVVYGDDGDRDNNGAFLVLGAGTTRGKRASTGIPTLQNFTSFDASNSTSVVCLPLNGDFSGSFNTTTGNNVNVQFRSQISTVEGGTGSAGQSAMCVVLTDIGGNLNNTPWGRDTLGFGQTFPNLNFAADYTAGYARVQAKMVLSMALQYSPARGAQSHVPDLLTRFSLRSPTSSYLRQVNSAVDPTFPISTGYPAGESLFPPVNVQLWNRLPAFGWDAGAKDPVTGSTAGISYGGGIVANTEQDRESELFADLGSKTIIFRPFRYRDMTLQALTVPLTKAGPPAVSSSLIGSLAYPTATIKDGLNLFTQGGTLAPLSVGTATGGKNMGFSIPPEYMPRFGRQDIPYYVDTASPAGSGTFLEGINHLFLDTTDPTQGQTVMMGGRNNAGPGNAIYSLFFRAAPNTFPASSYGDSGTFIDGAALNRPYYDARRAPVDISNLSVEGQTVIQKFNQVTSSDLGSGLKGIQLPPYLGIARVYGVYEYNNFVAGGGVTWNSSRSTYIGLSQPTPIQNLLRRDASAQSLFIMQDGALDLTTETGDHTYIVPSNVIDLTKIPTYAFGDQFEDFEYVVECVVFGFAKDWINGNDYVLCRQYNGEATQFLDGSNPQIPTTQMILPCAAHINAQAYSVIDRTVYQGDPYGTRNGVTQTVTDYLNRYGTVPLGSAAQLATPIQQFDSSGNFLPLTYNPRAFEVLSSVDFYTTMGTGKIGGKLYAGTSLDVGYLQNTPDVATRIPVVGAPDYYAFRNTFDRAFTEGQKDEPNRASIQINTISLPANVDTPQFPPEVLNGMSIELTNVAGQTVTKRGLTSPTDFRFWATDIAIDTPVAGQTTITTTRDHGLAVGNRVRFVQIRNSSGNTIGLNGNSNVLSVPNVRQIVILNGGLVASHVVSEYFTGQVVLGEQVDDPIFGIAARSGDQILTTTVRLRGTSAFPAGIAADSTVRLDFSVAGARIGNTVTVNGDGSFSTVSSSLNIVPWVSATNTVTIGFNNVSSVLINPGDFTLFLTITPRILDLQTTLFNLAAKIITDPVANTSILPLLPTGNNSLILQSSVAGAEGNRNRVALDINSPAVGLITVANANPTVITTALPLAELFPSIDPNVSGTSSVYLTGFAGAGAGSVNNRFWVATTTGANTFTIAFDSSIPANNLTIVAPAVGVDGTLMFPQRGKAENPFNVYSLILGRDLVWLTDPNSNRWITPDSVATASNFVGGVDVPVNAGSGNSQLLLTGMTERFPLGILLNDSDFLAENPLNDAASAVQTFPSALRPIQKLLPLTTGGQEYERFLGAPGDVIAQADGSILQYTPYNASTAPAGTRGYRMYRGGGSLYVLDGQNPGGPVDFAVTSFPPAIRPVLKGGLLVGKALLVRNFPEEAFTPSRPTSYGDEIQMLIITNGVVGDTLTTMDGLTLEATLGSAGYGEGYAASDRYRIDGKPMFRDFTFRHVDPTTVQPTPYIKVT